MKSKIIDFLNELKEAEKDYIRDYGDPDEGIRVHDRRFCDLVKCIEYVNKNL